MDALWRDSATQVCVHTTILSLPRQVTRVRCFAPAVCQQSLFDVATGIQMSASYITKPQVYIRVYRPVDRSIYEIYNLGSNPKCMGYESHYDLYMYII